MWRDTRLSRLKANDTNKEWQAEYEEKGISSRKRSEEMNKNYLAHIGMKAEDIKRARDVVEPRDGFTDEELERETRLEKRQIENIKPAKDKKETLEKSEEVRQNKSWWW